MLVNKWVALWLPFFYISLVAASTVPMTGDQLEKYIARKLKRNDRILRLNEKTIGDEGAKVLAQSPLLKNVLGSSHRGLGRGSVGILLPDR